MIWNIDVSHSTLGFSVRHMVIAKVRGRFTRWSGEIHLDEEDVTRSSVAVRVEAASIDTGEPKRDEHLRSADFFDAANHPEIGFVSRRIERDGDGYRVHGDLTIRGTTREVALDVEGLARGRDPWGNERLGFSARATIDRTEFGLAWNALLETGGVLVGEKVTIEIEAEAVAAAAATRAA